MPGPLPSGKWVQEEAAFPHPLPAPSRARGPELCVHGTQRVLRRLQSCALPALSPLWLLREAPGFPAAPFQYQDRVKKLAELSLVPGPAVSFYLSL